MNRTPDESYRQAAELLRHADGVAICAGFWRAYPALRAAKLNFVQIAAPIDFERQASLAWGSRREKCRGRLKLVRPNSPE